MQHLSPAPSSFSRRAFARLLGTTAAVAALPALPRIALAREGAPSVVRLDSNENPYGPSPAAMRAMQESLAEAFRYPDAAEEALFNEVAKFHGVGTDQVLLGNGSSDILRAAASAFLDKQRRAVIADPTFEIIALHAGPLGAEVVKVPLDARYAHDLGRMLEAAKSGAGLVYICNPNNPTATITPKSAVKSFLDAVPASTMVVVDEAYHHYADSADYESVIPLIASHPNLIVARTFSKIYALAGVRAGYGLAQKAAIEAMQRSQAFNNMNLVGLVAARASLGDTKHVADGRRHNSELRKWLAAEVAKMGFTQLPSDANFAMIDLGREVRPVIQALRARNVRPGRVFPAMPKHLRVTIGTADEMRAFVEALRIVTS